MRDWLLPVDADRSGDLFRRFPGSVHRAARLGGHVDALAFPAPFGCVWLSMTMKPTLAEEEAKLGKPA